MLGLFIALGVMLVLAVTTTLLAVNGSFRRPGSAAPDEEKTRAAPGRVRRAVQYAITHQSPVGGP